MRIGIVTTSFPRNDEDHAGRFVFDNARALVRLGHTVSVFAPESMRPLSWCPDDITLNWVPYARPRRLQQLFYGNGAPENLSAQPWLASLGPAFVGSLCGRLAYASSSVDAWISHWCIPSALAVAAVSSKPHLAVIHSGDLHLLERLPNRRALARFIARRARAVMTVTQEQRARFLALLRPGDGAEVFTSPMGIQLPATEPTLGVPGDRLRVLTLGRLVPVKGLDVLIHAALQCPFVDLTIAGDGASRQELQVLAAPARDRIHFVGFVGRAEKDRLLRTVDVMAVPSRVLPNGRTEGVPQALLEAMSYGLPIVASAVGGVSDVVTSGVQGLLVPPDSISELAAALFRMHEGAALRRAMSNEATKVARAHTWEVIAPQMMRRIELAAP